MAKKYGPVGEERNGVVWWLLSWLCAIIEFVWIFKVWSEIAAFTKKDISPGVKLLFMFIPILNIITMYQLNAEIAEMEEMVGIPEDERLNPIVNLILMCVMGLGIIFAQNHLNDVWAKA